MDSINIKSSDYNRELINTEIHPQNDEINVNDGSVDNNINCVGGKPFKCSSSREELQSDGLDCCGNVVSLKTETESDWVEKHCKSGELLYHYNKGPIKDNIMFGQPIIYKELCTIATQTDDYGCSNGLFFYVHRYRFN
ncbi:hypothetical protein QZH41_001985 [Actinostola sp. cb2023]|nr:hypothetical protein QZH41_001985 [Actinostola sp. cb2023]